MITFGLVAVMVAAAPILGVRGQLPIIGATLIGGAGIGWTWW